VSHAGGSVAVSDLRKSSKVVLVSRDAMRLLPSSPFPKYVINPLLIRSLSHGVESVADARATRHRESPNRSFSSCEDADNVEVCTVSPLPLRSDT